MIIEFCGLPASGKSTLCKALAKMGACGDVRLTRRIAAASDWPEGTPRYVKDRPDRALLYRATKFRTKFPNFFQSIEQEISDDTTTSFLFALTAAFYQEFEDLKFADTALLYDEGFLQRSAVLCFEKEFDLGAMLAKAPLPYALVFADVPPEVAFRRAVERHGRADKMRSAVISLYGDIDAFQERRSLIDHGCEIAAGLGVHVVKVKAQMPIDAAAREVHSALDGLLSSAT